MDGVRWNGSSFICADKVDDGKPPREEDIEDYTADFEDATTEQTIAEGRMTVSLLDIARPAKPKGKPRFFGRIGFWLNCFEQEWRNNLRLSAAYSVLSL
jgi:hypothetical protein